MGSRAACTGWQRSDREELPNTKAVQLRERQHGLGHAFEQAQWGDAGSRRLTRREEVFEFTSIPRRVQLVNHDDDPVGSDCVP